jgi:lipopolysaccharide biosynthesis glycosyltransferase
MTNDTIHVVSCVDKKYLQHLGVLITSLFENKTCSNDIVYHILHDELDENDKRNFVEIEKKYHTMIVFHDASSLSGKYDNIIRYGHVSRAGLYRISIPDILPAEIRKVLYLDCDIIVNRDIFELWSVDVNHYTIAAVGSALLFDRQQALMLPANASYFNSGVLLINIDRWRATNITEKVLNFMIKYPERRVYNDQDGLNAILYDSWLRLPPKYNQESILFYAPQRRITHAKNEYMEAYKNPVIIHYTGVIKNTKPWHYIDNHPLKKHYYKYLRLTAWCKFKPKPTGIIEIILKYYLWLFRYKMKTGIVFGNIFK